MPEPASTVLPFAVSEPPEPPYVRSPVTAIRLLGAVVVLALMYLALPGPRNQFATDFADLLGSAPRWLVTGVVSACQLGFLVPSMLGLVSQLALRRFSRIGRMLLAAVVCAAGLAALSKLVGSSVLPLLARRHRNASAALNPTGERYGIGAAFPTTIDLGVIASWMFIDRGHWSDRWRRIGLVVLVLGMAARLGVGLATPPSIVIAVAMAATASSLVQYVLGAPNTRARAVTVGEVLQRLGYEVAAIERAVGFRRFAAFRVSLAAGGQLFVKVVSRDSWAALLPVRMYRVVRFREVGADRPFRSLRSIVEHEALCALKAHSDGVPTARLAAVTEFPPDAMLLAFDARPYHRFIDLEPSRRTPDMLRSVWDVVATLQRSHTVHRHLNAESLMVDDDGAVALVDFSEASLGVVGSALSTDVAEVLAATSARLGAASAVEFAVAGVGSATVAAALPRLQPLALTGPTRSAVKAAGGLDELRAEVQRVTGVEEVQIVELERVKTRTLFTIGIAAVALWTLVPQLLGTGSVWGELRRANWWWAAAALGLSAVTYVGAAVALDGSVPDRLPLAPNVGVQMATSFVGLAAPGGALALTARFLQKRGVDTASAVAAVGVDTIAGLVVHVTLTALFFALAGSSGLKTFQLPALSTIGLIGAGVAAVAAVGLAVPWSRSLVTTKLLPATKRSLASVSEVARQPAKMIELFGGSLAITLGYLFALVVSVAAFGSGPAFTSVALVYLVGTAISTIAPTPGGIGAVEATLIAGLTSAGMPSSGAIAAVLLFRLATFWIPLLPGWGALTALQRTGNL